VAALVAVGAIAAWRIWGANEKSAPSAVAPEVSARPDDREPQDPPARPAAPANRAENQPAPAPTASMPPPAPLVPSAMRQRTVDPGPIDPRAARARMRDRVRSSGPDTDPRLLGDARALGAAFGDLADRARVDARLGEWECYAEGCLITFVQRSREDVERFGDLVAGSPPFAAWQGAKMRSLPVPREDGAYEVTWLFSKPASR